MTLKEIIGHPTDTDLRVFGGLQLIFLMIVAYVARQQLPMVAWAALLGLSAIVAVLGAAKPWWIRPIYVGWMTAVFPIGWAISHIALAVVYYLVLTPLGIWRRLTAGDPLDREFDSAAATYWRRRPPSRGSRSYFRQF